MNMDFCSSLEVARDSLRHEAGTTCTDHIQLFSVNLTLLSHLLCLLWLHQAENLNHLGGLGCLLRHELPLSCDAKAQLLDQMPYCIAPWPA